MSNNMTIGEQMAEADPIGYNIERAVLDKPGLYFGVMRFDYLIVFMHGIDYARYEGILHKEIPKRSNTFSYDASLQYWLLHTQSAALNSGAMHALELFYRCFGTKSTAFNKYREFLGAVIPHPMTTVCVELHAYENEHDLVRFDRFDNPHTEHDTRVSQLFYDSIKEMIRDAGYECNEIQVFVRREMLFVQTRFIFHTHEGWVDDTELIAKAEYHDKLISMHALVRNASADSLRKIGCYVCDEVMFSNEKGNNEVSDLGHLITDDTTFLSDYRRWREEIINH